MHKSVYLLTRNKSEPFIICTDPQKLDQESNESRSVFL